MLEIKPQEGPQTSFLSSPADIAIYGGAAGGGKTFALLLEAVRHVSNSRFSAVIFRRTLVDVKKSGSLLDTSMVVYGSIGGKPRLDTLTWTFPRGGKVSFGHLEHETTVLDWQGAQVPLLCFDELTHFSRTQFFYLLSRNRSTCGVRPYVRATTNPDADSWVSELISWWIDPDTGFPIPERGGVLRWFARIADVLEWADSDAELREKFEGCEPKSMTFIPARLDDNAILTKADPGYRANLMALPRVERERLLGGNWKIRPSAGLYFQRRWVTPIDEGAIPKLARVVRGWDLAATPKTEGNDPDWTAGTKIGITYDRRYVVLDHRRMRGSPSEVETELDRVATIDGKDVQISLPQDPGQAGKSQAAAYIKLLAGYKVGASVESRLSGDTPSAVSAKVSRFGPFSAQAEAGNVLVVRGDWNQTWFSQLEAFPDGIHDDDADSTSRAFNALFGPGAVVVAPFVYSAGPRDFYGARDGIG